MASGVRNLNVWQESVLLGGEVVKAMRQGSRREIKAFTDHVMHAAVAVAAAVADGYGHFSNAQQRPHFVEAKRSLVALETLLAIARQAGLITPAAQAALCTRISSVSRLLTGYLTYLDRQIAIEQETQLARPLAPIGSVVAHAASAVPLADRASH